MTSEPLSEPRPALKDLMAAVGYLLLYWGRLERRLAGSPIPDPLQPVRRLRNDLCHTLESAQSFPLEARDPELTCRRPNGEIVTYSWTDLQNGVRLLETSHPRV